MENSEQIASYKDDLKLGILSVDSVYMKYMKYEYVVVHNFKEKQECSTTWLKSVTQRYCSGVISKYIPVL